MRRAAGSAGPAEPGWKLTASSGERGWSGNQRVADRLLARRGHVATVACNGRDALQAVEAGTFDVILMDVQMPEMDGLEATAHIRARERGSGERIPILALTASAMEGDRQRCPGMDGYVSKPIRPEESHGAIEQAAGARRAAPAAV